MTITLVELKEKLKQLDEVLLCETLDISSEELVEQFTDLIEEKYDELISEFQEETDESSD